MTNASLIKEGRDLHVVQLGRASLLVKEKEQTDSVEVGLFGAVAVMTRSDQLADLIDQFGHAKNS